jgi:small-conductance mechanosensitive channel
MHIHEVTKPPTPEHARIRAMQAQVRQAQQRVKLERLRQQQARLTQQRTQLNQLQETSKEKTHCVATVG